MNLKENIWLLGIKEVYDSFHIPNDSYRFLSPDIALVRSLQGVMKLAKHFFRLRQPFRMTEGRVVYFRSGSCHLRVNLKETVFSAGELVVASPGTVIEFIDISDDFELSMLAFSNTLMEGWLKEELLQTYLQGRLFLHLPLSESFYKRIRQIMELIWELIHDNPLPTDDIRSLIFILFHQIDCYRKNEGAETDLTDSRQEEVFNKFLNLLNKYAIRERSLTFYADKLCLSPRYLSTLIKQASGRTVMDWVNEAVVQEAKLQLRHTKKMIYQISDELNFPNASFFTKYFRRLTGMTPKEYKEKFG